jgi:hypothetical protein
MLDFRLLAFWSTGTCVSVLEQMAKNKGIGEPSPGCSNLQPNYQRVRDLAKTVTKILYRGL